jgi:diguanylate cyclase (GGDEF)-like protein
MNTLIYRDCKRLLETLAESDGGLFLILEAPASDPAAARVLWTNSAEMSPNLWPRVWAASPDLCGGWAALLRGETVRSRQRFSWDEGLSFFQATLVPFGISDSSSSAVRFGVILQDHSEQEQVQRETQDLMTRGHCLLWRAQVTQENGSLAWQFDISNLEAALQWLPIRHQDGDTLIYSWASARSPEETKRMDAASRSAIMSGAASYAQEFDVRLADGQFRHIAETVRIEVNGAGCWNLTGVCTDATDRHEAEGEMRKLLTNARCLIWYADVEGNPAQQLQWDLRISNESAVQRWLPISVKPGQNFLQAWEQARLTEDQWDCDQICAAALQTESPGFSQEFRVRLANGQIRCLAEDVQVELLGPGRWHLVGVCTDITERKAEQDALRDMVSHARCLVWRAEVVEDGEHMNWETQVFNENAALSWLSIEVLPGQSFVDAWTGARFPEDMKRCNEIYLAALRAGRPSYSQEYRCCDVAGKTYWLAEDVQIEVLDEGRWRLFGVCTDITERRALEEERERMLTQALEQADRDPLTGLFNHRAFHAHLAREADRAQRGGSVLGIAVIDLDNFKFFNDAYGHLSGDDVLRQVAAALQGVCRSYDTLARFGGDEFAVLIPGSGPGDVAHLGARLSSCLEKVRYRPPGASSDIPLSLSVGMAVFPLDAAAPLAALHLADERLMRVKSGERGHGAQAEQLRASLAHGVEGFSMLDALVVAVDNKDRYTRSHSEDVLCYCLQIAEALALEPEIAHPLQVAALLHDVGKIGIPDHILRKPGKLTEAEYSAMQQHPVMGAAIVAAVPGLEGTLGAVRHHHERWDGLGYPDGLAGEATPLEARIMAVADAYSAMTTDRPYRKGMVPEEARAVLEAGAGTQWDPRCVHAFLQVQRQLQCLKANIPLLLTRGA